MQVRPYILAGGRSSRMGRDKAMIPLRGRTLLGRAVDTLRAVPSLADDRGQVTITVVGERTDLEGADRVVEDRYPGCGPMGGIEAALRDLTEGCESAGIAEWALFLPVDMPFLPIGLIDALLKEWFEAARRGAKVCYVVVDGRPQPLVSMVHRSLHHAVVQALTAGQFKVTPVLQSATSVLASRDREGIRYENSALHATFAHLEEHASRIAGWISTAEQERLKRLWFSNLNTEEDFSEAETLSSDLGSD